MLSRMDELPQAGDDPVERFRRDLVRAREATADPYDAHACVVATAGADGLPSARFVLVKDIDAEGVTFFTNYGSRKARELDVRPHAALVIHWAPLGQQVRVEGRVERLSEEASDAYFASRPRESQLAAWASRQSEAVASREALDEAFERCVERFADAPVPRPPFWGGYRIVPERIEFWYSRVHRMHDRFAYRRDGDDWKWERLFP